MKRLVLTGIALASLTFNAHALMSTAHTGMHNIGGTASTASHSTNINSNARNNNDNTPLGGSNGIAGANSGSIPQTKSTGAKINEAGKHFGRLGEQASRMSGSGHSGVSELNINPHHE